MLRFCLNDNSFNSDDRSNAFNLLHDAIMGMCVYGHKHKCPANEMHLYSHKSLDTVMVAANYTFKQFRSELATRDRDSVYVLDQLLDYSPYEEYIEQDSTFYNFSTCYIPDVILQSDTLPLAYSHGAILLSQNTHDVWSSNTVTFYNMVNSDPLAQESYSLSNISSKLNGKALFESDKAAKEQLPELEHVIYSHSFINWYQSLTDKQKKLTRNKIELCNERKFRVDKDLIKKLQQYELWEIRYDNVDGGAIRILISYHDNDKLFLTGFIKHGDGDYPNECLKANSILKHMVSQ